tara:strand:- start:662 stop:1156 length:495 start_codon:yes stop_codon:yes gene_type:complete
MSTVTTLASTVRNPGARGRSPYYVQNEIDFAAAVTAKGTALAAADIIEVLTIPADTMIISAGMECTAVHTGTSSDCALDLGVTGGDPDAFVDAFDFDAAAAGAYAVPAAPGSAIVPAAADTLDILIQAQTGTTLTGKMRVFAWLADVDDIGVLEASDVDRDTLA